MHDPHSNDIDARLLRAGARSDDSDIPAVAPYHRIRAVLPDLGTTSAARRERKGQITVPEVPFLEPGLFRAPQPSPHTSHTERAGDAAEQLRWDRQMGGRRADHAVGEDHGDILTDDGRRFTMRLNDAWLSLGAVIISLLLPTDPV